jgi:hypothetical protein
MTSARKIRRRKSERGYALLLVAFAATVLLIAAMTAAPGIKANRTRDREKEMIWRGNQYVRGIKMYYRKTGKFPTSLDDLMKPQIGNIRFMRQAYKDPMNKEDGSWRLIYVGPSGQLIGSLRPQPALTLPTGIPGASGVGTPAANLPGAGIGAVNANGPLGSPTTGGPGSQQGTGTQAPGTATGVSTDTDANGNIPPPNAEPTTIIGGNVIGVGSKASGRSVIYYQEAKNYRLFEFVWDPSKEAGQFARPQNIPGATQPGATPGTQQSPFGNPGTGGTNPPPGNPPPQNNPPQN